MKDGLSKLLILVGFTLWGVDMAADGVMWWSALILWTVGWICLFSGLDMRYRKNDDIK